MTILETLLRNPEVGERGETFAKAIELLIKGGGTSIVETGCIRWLNDLASGGSTFIFALVAQQYGIKFDSIDFSATSIEASKATLDSLVEYVAFHQADSVETLKEWSDKIDLLYLDSLGSSMEPVLAQEHQLREIEAAYDKLSDNAVVLLDDNNHSNGGKTVLSKQFLVDKGWRILIDKTQCLLERKQ